MALDEQGRPDFNRLQNFREAEASIRFVLFDCLMYRGESFLKRPLAERREMLQKIVRRGHRLILSAVVRSLPDIEQFAQAHRLEGIVAKRADSVYQPGKRTGAWSKHRFNRSQEFVIGGYVPSHLGIDALIVGVYRDKKLHYTARVRAGFVPATRSEVFAAIKDLTTTKCPFVNLPEKEPGRWGVGVDG